MTPEQIGQLTEVNREVNAAVPYSDVPAPNEPVDFWTAVPIPGFSFVCRDFVLMKMDRLKELGWPKDALRVLLCYVETSEYHAVAAVTDGDTWILDSRQDAAYPMSSPPPGYRWDRIQIAGATDFVPVA